MHLKNGCKTNVVPFNLLNHNLQVSLPQVYLSQIPYLEKVTLTPADDKTYWKICAVSKTDAQFGICYYLGRNTPPDTEPLYLFGAGSRVACSAVMIDQNEALQTIEAKLHLKAEQLRKSGQ